MKHVLTHQILLADFYLWQPKVRPQLPSDFIWIDKQDLEKYALPRLIEVLLKEIPKPKILSPFHPPFSPSDYHRLLHGPLLQGTAS